MPAAIGRLNTRIGIEDQGVVLDAYADASSGGTPPIHTPWDWNPMLTCPDETDSR